MDFRGTVRCVSRLNATAIRAMQEGNYLQAASILSTALETLHTVGSKNNTRSFSSLEMPSSLRRRHKHCKAPAEETPSLQGILLPLCSEHAEQLTIVPYHCVFLLSPLLHCSHATVLRSGRAILFYNLAVSLHRHGIMQSCKQALLRALTFYKHAHQTLSSQAPRVNNKYSANPEANGPTDMVLLFAAIYHNTGQIQAEYFCGYKKAQQLRTRLAQLLCWNHGTTCDDRNYDFFSFFHHSLFFAKDFVLAPAA